MNEQVIAVQKEELDSILQEAIDQVTKLGILLESPIISKVRNYKATSYFGQCRYRPEQKKFEITISDYHLENGYNAVMETMTHEVLHACKGSEGHGEQWKTYADMVNEEYGYNISRCGSSQNGYALKTAERSINYIIECPGCGTKWYRTRRSKLVTHTYQCRCGKCKTNLVRTK